MLLPAAGNDNTNANTNNIIFTNKDTKLYVPIVSLINKRLLKTIESS